MKGGEKEEKRKDGPSIYVSVARNFHLVECVRLREGTIPFITFEQKKFARVRAKFDGVMQFRRRKARRIVGMGFDEDTASDVPRANTRETLTGPESGARV